MNSTNLDGNAAMDELNVTGVLKLQANGQEIELSKRRPSDRYGTDGRICI